jgi:hypothetical protein
MFLLSHVAMWLDQYFFKPGYETKISAVVMLNVVEPSVVILLWQLVE